MKYILRQVKLEMTNKEIRNFETMWKLNNTLKIVKENRIKRKNLKRKFTGNHIEYFEMNKMKTLYQTYRMQIRQRRKIYPCKNLHY